MKFCASVMEDLVDSKRSMGDPMKASTELPSAQLSSTIQGIVRVEILLVAPGEEDDKILSHFIDAAFDTKLNSTLARHPSDRLSLSTASSQPTFQTQTYKQLPVPKPDHAAPEEA
ncbi:hypothetical protein MMC28_006649 [Mycoblastus sanguinarius]|nr:hypothetical protein [Mycoblastus sanguinarius]